MKQAYATLRIFLAAIILCLTISGCTQNDGRIGDLFGQWQLESVVDESGETVVDTPQEFFWGFQSWVVSIRRTLPHHSVTEYWGSWSRSGDTLQLDFTHSDNDAPPGNWPYLSPTEIGFPASPCKVDFHVERMTADRMVLTLTATNGQMLTYTLHKLY